VLGTPAPVVGWLTMPDGAVIRHARWEPAAAPPRATLLMLNGRSEFIEKYDELARSWTERGFRVLSFDWRGQGLSTRSLPPPRQQRHFLTDFAVLEEDLEFFLERIVMPLQVGPLVLYAHSMGGHVAARYLTSGWHHFAAAVLSAPMVDIATRGFPRPLVRGLAAAMSSLGFGGAYAPGQGDYDATRHDFIGNPVSHDPRRWAVHHQWFRTYPELRVGGVTWAWLRETFRSVDLLNRPETSAAVELPMLLLSPMLDPLVPPEALRAMSLRYRNCRLVRYPDALHEILMEADGIRSRAWTDIDRFLAEALPAEASGGGILGDAAVSA
jgi:lysophospholipase